jgi:threonine synthase
LTSATYIEPLFGTTYSLQTPRWCSERGNPLMITQLPGIGRAQIDAGVRSLWRYSAAFPLAVRSPISLGEGLTPLVRRAWRGVPVHFKLEWFSPTGSFKDRGASVMLSVLREQGVHSVLEDSSGNGGAAIAAYAASGGMYCRILVPASTQSSKVDQMRAYGAEVELVPGTRQETADAAMRLASNIFYASHNWQAFFLQGTKTLAYELWEQLDFRAPDNVIVPLGAGSNVLGCYIGFSELVRAGSIANLPRIFGVQPENCSPIHQCFTGGFEELPVMSARPTIAEGAAIAHPVRLREVLTALRESGGATVALSEAQIVQAVARLAALGFYAEPTSAMTAAAMTVLLEQGRIAASDCTVLILTGTGLKASQRIAELGEQAP